jgi:hypothetical protein
VANYRASRNTNSSSSKTNVRTKQKNKLNQFKLFTFKREFLNICVGLQTALGAEAHPAEGQCLEEQFSVVKLRVFRAGA